MHTDIGTNKIPDVRSFEVGTMAVMASPRKRPDSKKRPNREGRAVTLWLRADVFAALEEWRKRQPVPPIRTTIVETALIQFLASQGVTVHAPDAD